MINQRLLLGGFLAAAALSLTHCGQDNGYLYQEKLVANPDVTGQRGEFALAKSSYNGATWLFQCDANAPMPASVPGQLVVNGNAATNSAARERLVGTPVKFKGQLCAPKTYNRDVVFMVDVSGSMDWIDRAANGRCKRLDALEAVIATLPASAQIGLLTFEEDVVASSTALFPTKAALYADLTAGGSSIDSIVCHAGGRSFLDVGMTKAKALLEMGRADQTKKELFVLSDGDPEEGPVGTPTPHADAATAIANDIKNNGIHIGTDVIKATIAGLRFDTPQIDKWMSANASHDLAGAVIDDSPDHVAGISTRVAQFAINILEAATLSYRIQGQTAFTVLDIKANLQGQDFEIGLPPFPIDRTQKGYEAVLDYVDTDHRHVVLNSTLTWED